MSLHSHAVPRTTHTMNLDQVAEINERLAATSLSTADIGLEAPAGVLAEIVLEGSPTFGYLWARLRAGGQEAGRVLLHTDQLKAISRALHLAHHHWGL
ncbi:hypothetical protein [Kineosporia sp. R_H_3]|uniref:hypothetical protein n=1 Tax=Kineosporia sp. R_H_3 TaxID=1961848 RepID=UPI000B4B5E48|nr:hypothetical protein [Kineosporia sp. R_H_3]